jgi:hypothetical protein
MIMPVTCTLSHTHNPIPVHTLFDYLIAITCHGNKLAAMKYCQSMILDIL